MSNEAQILMTLGQMQAEYRQLSIKLGGLTQKMQEVQQVVLAIQAKVDPPKPAGSAWITK